ncbi:acyl-CoA thioesterase [uncultured Roseovarius sp.]|uniref:acyl-CoA thioesterase n=1 Tax=uncultured Roseovarius sp. TaxID=293344 RepID=UPI0025E5C5CA|nr:acyl-CoA thioesterase [uncultured Roseovarius sp.]
MYPVVRLIWQMFKHRKDTLLGVTDTHVSRHMCLPWDIDLWMELNNGRTLTLFDMGRIPLAHRVGLIAALKRRKWGLTVAGVSVRYRRRIRMFETIEMRSRAVWWDDKFVYIEQSMWKTSGECANHILLRTAVTGKSGIVPPEEVMAEVGQNVTRPDAPEWVSAWTAAEAKRPWPPMQE